MTTETMTDLITAEEAGKLLDRYEAFRAGEDIWTVNVHKTLSLARSVIALHAQLADAQTAQAMAVGRCAEEAVRTTAADGQRNIKDQWRAEIGEEVASAIRDLAPIDGLALVRELRAERDAASAVAATAYGASLDWEQILKDDALWQAQDDIAKSRVACMAAEADRDRLAAANAALEAKVAGLREAVDEQTKARAQHWLRRTMTAPEDAEVEALCERCGYGAVMDAASRLWARKPHGSGAFYIGGCIGFKSDEEARAALATQEAGNG